MNELQHEEFRTLLQRVLDEGVKRRIERTANSNWLATAHNGYMYYEVYEINEHLRYAIKRALNPELKEQDND